MSENWTGGLEDSCLTDDLKGQVGCPHDLGAGISNQGSASAVCPSDVYRTKRMILRPASSEDVSAIFAILGDPDVMRYSDICSDEGACLNMIRAHEAQRTKLGFGPWVLIESSASRIIGWGGLFQAIPESDLGPELVYFLAKDAWGRGYAAELVDAALSFGRNRLQLESFTAIVRPQNDKSIRVLTQAGFRLQRYCEQLQRMVYRADFPSSCATR